MGEVWRARDTNLDRDVAIKRLRFSGDEKSRDRFRREALVLSKLSHPGVATIFDFTSGEGSDYLVMEYVPGGSLASRLKQGPLTVDQVLRYGIAIADALEAAHQSGFLHRDLKPGNIVISRHDHPKILDFGIALLLNGSEGVQRITQAGMIVGSVPYMSPEQLFGDANDARADIYSLGVLLFEMVTGRVPFVKARPEALMYAIINNAPPSALSIRADAPPALDRLIDDCLQKDRASRPASAAVVASSLRAILDHSGPAVEVPRPVVRSIAVLPLRNISSESAQNYFADGMTEMFISELSMMGKLRVISLTSAMKYRGTTLSVSEIARELNVNAILEGSILLAGDRVRVNVRLVSARDEQTLWADRYDRKIEDILELQSNLAETVAKEIEVQLTPEEVKKLAARKTVNAEAQVEFFKSRHHTFVGSREGVNLGISHALVAVELDPNFALAWAALADGYMAKAIRGMMSPMEAGRLATDAATRAIKLDPLLPDAHAALGNLKIHTLQFREGIRSLQRAIELNPGHAMARFIYARALNALDRPAEAIAEAQKAVSLDPLSVLIHSGVGDAYYFAREFEKSVLSYKIARELDPRFDVVHNDLTRALEALGRLDEARAACEEGRKAAGKTTVNSLFGIAHIELAAGNGPEARRLLEELKALRSTGVVSAWGIAALHACLGDIDDAFKWLDIAVEEKAAALFLLRVHPRMDNIRQDPRYRPLIERLGLAD